jgi:hypothetical protein
MADPADIKAVAAFFEWLAFQQHWTRLDGTEQELRRAVYVGDGASRLAAIDRDILERGCLILIRALVLKGEE